MTAARERFDSAFEPPPTEQPIAGTGLGWLYFMGLNSNVRYNALNAAEDVLYARCEPHTVSSDPNQVAQGKPGNRAIYGLQMYILAG